MPMPVPQAEAPAVCIALVAFRPSRQPPYFSAVEQVGDNLSHPRPIDIDPDPPDAWSSVRLSSAIGQSSTPARLGG